MTLALAMVRSFRADRVAAILTLLAPRAVGRVTPTSNLHAQ